MTSVCCLLLTVCCKLDGELDELEMGEIVDLSISVLTSSSNFLIY
jgi:hypothetical protein